MLEGFKSLPALLAERPPTYTPKMFWDIFEWETHASKFGPCGQKAEAVQVGQVARDEQRHGSPLGGGNSLPPMWV